MRDDQVVFGAKIDAILGLLDSADAAARDAEAAQAEKSLPNLVRSEHETQLDDRPTQGQ